MTGKYICRQKRLNQISFTCQVCKMLIFFIDILYFEICLIDKQVRQNGITNPKSQLWRNGKPPLALPVRSVMTQCTFPAQWPSYKNDCSTFCDILCVIGVNDDGKGYHGVSKYLRTPSVGILLDAVCSRRQNQTTSIISLTVHKRAVNLTLCGEKIRLT